jgi:ABC-type sugar transport system permease subunit
MYPILLEVNGNTRYERLQGWCDLLCLYAFFSVTSNTTVTNDSLYRILLYFPQAHSKSFTGQKILSQKRPSLRLVSSTVVDRLWLQNFTSWFFQDRFRRASPSIFCWIFYRILIFIILLFIIALTIDLNCNKKIDYSTQLTAFLPGLLNFKLLLKR